MSAPQTDVPAVPHGEGVPAGTSPTDLAAAYREHNAGIRRARAEYEAHPFLDKRTDLTPRAARTAHDRAAQLEQRQREAVRLWRRGWTRQQIAWQVHRSPKTVSQYLQEAA